MQQHLARYSLALSAASLSGAVLAHPGHDHDHWSSSATHAVLLMSVLAVAAAAVWIAVRRQKRRAGRRDGAGPQD